MSRYAELRRFYRLPHQERAAMVRQEMLEALVEAQGALTALTGAGADRLQGVFGEHSGELIEIAVDSAQTIERQRSA